MSHRSIQEKEKGTHPPLVTLKKHFIFMWLVACPRDFAAAKHMKSSGLLPLLSKTLDLPLQVERVKERLQQTTERIAHLENEKGTCPHTCAAGGDIEAAVSFTITYSLLIYLLIIAPARPAGTLYAALAETDLERPLADVVLPRVRALTADSAALRAEAAALRRRAEEAEDAAAAAAAATVSGPRDCIEKT
jgi:hypothetical protein